MNIRAVHTDLFREGDELAAFVRAHIKKVPEGAIIAVASKIVALSEGRTADPKSKEALIKKESSWAKKILPKWWLTIRDGVVIVNAGIDESNAGGKLILLPNDCFKAAGELRKKMRAIYGVKKLGVVITDSRVAPLRAGVTGVALGYAGFKGVRDYRGKKDIFGKRLEVTQTNLADSLATAAALVMGEGNEQQPLAIIEGAPVIFSEKVNRGEIKISESRDIYKHLFI